MAAKRRVPSRHRLIEFRFRYKNGHTLLFDVPEIDLNRSGDRIDVMVYLMKRNDDMDPKVPERIIRTGRRHDRRTGDRI